MYIASPSRGDFSISSLALASHYVVSLYGNSRVVACSLFQLVAHLLFVTVLFFAHLFALGVWTLIASIR